MNPQLYGAPHASNRPQLFVDSERSVFGTVNSYSPEQLPHGSQRNFVEIVASDGAFSWGLLHLPPGPRPKTVVIAMHPRVNQSRQYLAPSLLEAGYAMWCQTTRALNNDSDMVHEELLRDVAAGMRMLRERGFETIVFLGASGGASLLSFYQWQASLQAHERIETAPHGDPTGFADEEMPTGDLFVGVAPHAGEGMILQDLIDPAIVDEAHPTAVDPALDMFNPANGYRPFPEESKYDPEWVDEYRRAQRARVARIDVIARAMLADYRDAREAARLDALGVPMARRALMSPFMNIFGTSANPGHLDLSINPNHRTVGGLLSSAHPLRDSYGPGGFARLLSARAWLSTWSGQSANAEWSHAAEHLHIPTLVVFPMGDVAECAPQIGEEIFTRIPATDKTWVPLDYAHHYLLLHRHSPVFYDPRAKAGEVITAWLDDRDQSTVT
ncbi:alpha/beta hydrolase family protein [Rhodococcus sp. LB1]|uniref:alpha/beta hydrolase family protein n=1 Tax=Rhodococcus sp. LB1 TaxID=1807499 RepID=UPI00077A881E|nr:hypothetical protein [Rhodococcus sp. LB1]KXX55888.1 hypothetical protein AZG88_02325 [Rhodococcus sp. LB1]